MLELSDGSRTHPHHRHTQHASAHSSHTNHRAFAAPQPGWTATSAFTRENLDYPHAVYTTKGDQDLPALVPPTRRMRAADASGVNPFAATQTDWVTSLHAPRVDGKQQRRAWPEYTPDSSASIGRRWFGATLRDYREEGRLWDNSLGSSLDAHRRPTARPRIKDILQESVFLRQPGGPSSMGSRGRMGMGLTGAGVLPRGHGGYWAS
jgi:hypothetical protein